MLIKFIHKTPEHSFFCDYSIDYSQCLRLCIYNTIRCWMARNNKKKYGDALEQQIAISIDVIFLEMIFNRYYISVYDTWYHRSSCNFVFSIFISIHFFPSFFLLYHLFDFLFSFFNPHSKLKLKHTHTQAHAQVGKW